MPFYFRKSISAGPFRFNLSKSGVGLSVGVKGFRIGTGPRGHYVQAGRGGLYYRASIGGGRSAQTQRHKQQQVSTIEPNHPRQLAEEGRVVMVEIASSDVLGMRDSSVADLIDDMNAKQARIALGPLLGLGTAGLGLLAMLAGNTAGAIVLLLALPASGIGAWLDQSRRRSVLFYNLDAEATTRFERVTEEFDLLAACQGKWHIEAGGAVKDVTTWKRNAGAKHLLDRKSAHLRYGLPRILRSNVTPPSLKLGKRTFYFFPKSYSSRTEKNLERSATEILTSGKTNPNSLRTATPPTMPKLWITHGSIPIGAVAPIAGSRATAVCRFACMTSCTYPAGLA